METTANTTRPLYTIAREILADWQRPYFGAVPYVQAMAHLASAADQYGLDDGRSVVRYFLANASTWRGETAKRVKAELRAMV